VAENDTGYFGVCRNNPGKPKPYQARMKRNGKDVYLGSFTTAKEAALCAARTPEGQAVAAERAGCMHACSKQRRR
jgi:hypothetical protein